MAGNTRDQLTWFDLVQHRHGRLVTVGERGHVVVHSRLGVMRQRGHLVEVCGEQARGLEDGRYVRGYGPGEPEAVESRSSTA